MSESARKPKHPTAAEMAARVEYARQLLAGGAYKSTIAAALRAKFGPLCARTVEVYLSRAREKIHAAAHDGRVELRCESLAFYRSIIADPKADHRDKLKARERIDKLLALELRLPPVEVLCEYLGFTPEQLAAAVASVAGRPVPDPDAAGAAGD